MSVFPIDILNRLDDRAFLGFRIWRFSLLNSVRFFSWYYFVRMILLHPIAAIMGVKRYRRCVQEEAGQARGTLPLKSALQRLNNDKPFLIAPGFCLKPYDHEQGGSICPVGHFNHSCMLLENSQKLLVDERKWPSPCKSCGISSLAKIAALYQADVYIMTSAIDIARDIYLPAIRNQIPSTGLFFLCSYSVDPFTFGLAMSGINGAIITFCSGDCKTHQAWSAADIGIKNEQTFLNREDLEQIKYAPGKVQVANYVNYVKQGNIYRYQATEKKGEQS